MSTDEFFLFKLHSVCCRYKPVDHKQILLPLREAFEDLFSQTYSRKQNLTFLGHVQTCFRGKRWQDLLKLMDHVCKSALASELQEKSDGGCQCQPRDGKPNFEWQLRVVLCVQLPCCRSAGRLWPSS